MKWFFASLVLLSNLAFAKVDLEELRDQAASISKELPLDIGFGSLVSVEVIEGPALLYTAYIDPESDLLEGRDLDQLAANVESVGGPQMAEIFCNMDDMAAFIEQGVTLKFSYLLEDAQGEELARFSIDKAMCSEIRSRDVTWQSLTLEEAIASVTAEFSQMQALLPFNLAPGLVWTVAQVDGANVIYVYEVDLTSRTFGGMTEKEYLEYVGGEGKRQLQQTLCRTSATRSLLEAGLTMDYTYQVLQGGRYQAAFTKQDC